MRLFAAIDLPDAVKDEITDWWQEASVYLDDRDWRPVAPHLWHLTLAFYGDVGRRDADDLCEMLAECSEQRSAIQLCTNDFGLFPRPTRPRVFWAGIEDREDGKRLKKLAHCCRRAGHATVRKHTAKESPFRGHITMARARGYPGPLQAAKLLAMPDVPDIDWCAERFHLFQSILRAEGPQYRRLETFNLTGSVTGPRGTDVR